MKKCSLKDFGISESQYSKYKDYKTSLDLNQKKLDEFDDRISQVIFFTIFIILIILYLISNEFVNQLYINEEYWKIALIILASLFVFSFAYFLTGIGVLLSLLVEFFLSILGIKKLTKYIYIKLQPKLNKESYFDRVEQFENHQREYQDYIEKLTKEYPEITNFNFDVKLYFNRIFGEIIEDEKQYVNNSITKFNLLKQREYWLGMDGIKFEQEVSSIFRKLGYKVQTTKAVADGGVDIKLWKDGIYSIVQCKNHRNKVGPSVVRDLFGTMHREKASNAVLICSGGFNSGVYKFVKGLPIELLDINQFLDLVNKTNTQQPELVENVSNSFIFNQNATHEFKIIGELYLVYAFYKNAILKDQTIYFPKPVEKEICLYDSKEKAKNRIELIQRCNNKPLGNQSKYEIGEWKLTNTTNNYYRKTLYYIRVLRQENDFLKRENMFRENNFTKPGYRKMNDYYRYKRRY